MTDRDTTITGALKISVVSSAFLIAIGWTDRTVHIKDNLLEWLSLVNSIDTLTARRLVSFHVAPAFPENFPYLHMAA